MPNPRNQVRQAHLAALASGLAMLIAIAFVADSAHARRVRVPVAVRITAYVNAKPAGVNPQYEWVVSHRRNELRLYVQRLFVKTGDVSAGQIGRDVEPYPVQFQLAGQKEALAKLTTAEAGTRVVIDAYLEMAGARIMMLDTVEAAPEPTEAKAPAATP